MSSGKDVESPWDGEKPSYKAVPSVNPKTQQPVQVYACTGCGAAVVSRKLHSKWHRERDSRTWGVPF